MNLLLINYEYPPYGGGAGSAMKQIAFELALLGHKVSVLTGGLQEYRGLDGNVEVIRVDSRRKRKDRASFYEMLDFLVKASIFVLKRPNKEWDASIAFFQMPSGPVSALLKLRWKIPYIVSLRGGDVPGCEPGLRLAHCLLTPLRRLIYRGATAVIANSDELADKSKQADPFPVAIISNGVDTDFFCPRTISGTADSEGSLRLLFAGRFHRQKDVPGLLEKLGQARREGVDFKLCLVGDGPERAMAKKAVGKAGLTGSVEWLGWLSKTELLGVYQRSDCLLNLSSYEGLPNTVLEAMACGLPIVASNIGPHRELIEDGVNGYLISLDSSQALTEALLRLSRNRYKCREMGENNRIKVLGGYSWRTVATEYISLFGK